MPASDRERVGVALLQHTQDLADAVTVLVGSNLPGPALVLARPLVETYVRAIWVLKCAEETEIDGFLKTGRPTPWKFQQLVAVLEDRATAEAVWVKQVAKGIEAFHDLTHGGRLHVLGRVGSETIAPNYAEQDVDSLLGIVIEVQIRSGLELFELTGNGDAIEEFAVFSKRFDRRPLRDCGR